MSNLINDLGSSASNTNQNNQNSSSAMSPLQLDPYALDGKDHDYSKGINLATATEAEQLGKQHDRLKNPNIPKNPKNLDHPHHPYNLDTTNMK